MSIAFSVTYATLVIGLSDSIFSKFMQIGGIVASLVSVAKTCAADHLTKIDADKKEPDFSTTIKSLFFFGPHVLWRTTATAFVATFLKFYALIPLAVHVLVCIGITFFLHTRHENQLEGSLGGFILSLLTPTSSGNMSFHQSQLKATMLTSSLILLPCLLFIHYLPLLPPETVLCTLGLSHLDLGQPVPQCSSCFNTTVVDTGN